MKQIIDDFRKIHLAFKWLNEKQDHAIKKATDVSEQLQELHCSVDSGEMSVADISKALDEICDNASELFLLVERLDPTIYQKEVEKIITKLETNGK